MFATISLALIAVAIFGLPLGYVLVTSSSTMNIHRMSVFWTNVAATVSTSIGIILFAGLRYMKENAWYDIWVALQTGTFVTFALVIPWLFVTIASRRNQQFQNLVPAGIALQLALIALTGPFLVFSLMFSIPTNAFLICSCCSLASWWLAKRWPQQLVIGSTIALAITFSIVSLAWIVRIRVPEYITTDYVMHDRVMHYFVAVSCIAGLLTLTTARRVGVIAYWPSALVIAVLSLWWHLPTYPTETALRQWFATRAATFTQLGRMLHEDVTTYGSAEPLQEFLTTDRLSHEAFASVTKLPSARIATYRGIQNELGTLVHVYATNNLFYVWMPGSGVADQQWGYVYAFDPRYLDDAKQKLDSGPQLTHIPRFAQLASPWFLYGHDNGIVLDGP